MRYPAPMLSPAAALAGTVYDVLLADPPWEYDQRMGRGVAEDHYSVMDQAAIEGLELPALSQEAVLYLWATSPLLPEALRVLEAWGFKYKSSLCWVKNNVGVGFWSRGPA